MILVALLLGIIVSMIGAISPGASNLAVIKAAVNENIHQAMKISYGAGVGEVVLAFLALSFGMVVQDFFVMNLWIQWLLIAALIGIGIFMLRSRPKEEKDPSTFSSKYLTGFLLSIINPPVLIYWIVVFSILPKYFALSEMSDTLILLLFFTGVFLGKVITLYGYGKLGYLIQHRKGNFKCLVNQIIGGVLMVIGLVQGVKLWFF